MTSSYTKVQAAAELRVIWILNYVKQPLIIKPSAVDIKHYCSNDIHILYSSIPYLKLYYTASRILYVVLKLCDFYFTQQSRYIIYYIITPTNSGSLVPKGTDVQGWALTS